MNIRWSKTANDSAGIVKAASEGFDRIEFTVDYVMKIADEQFVAQKDLFLQHDIIPEVCASVLPADVFVTEKGFNLYVWAEYLKKALNRLSELGCRKMVWGNGRARVLPLEGDTSEMKSQILQFLHMICETAAKYDITVLIEPLGPNRTNYLNSMKEIREFLPLIPDENLAASISLRELEEIGLSTERFSDFSGLIRHVYLENPQQKKGMRISPRPDDGVDYGAFLSALEGIQYDGVVNLPADADSETLQYCRSLI